MFKRRKKEKIYMKENLKEYFDNQIELTIKAKEKALKDSRINKALNIKDSNHNKEIQNYDTYIKIIKSIKKDLNID